MEHDQAEKETPRPRPGPYRPPAAAFPTPRSLFARDNPPAFLTSRFLLPILSLAATSLPYLIAWFQTPPGSVFWAVPPINSADADQYLALTRQALTGRLLLDDPFTSEPHVARLFLPHVLWDGLLARLLGGSVLAAFHLSRVVYGAALLAAAVWLHALLLRPRNCRGKDRCEMRMSRREDERARPPEAPPRPPSLPPAATAAQGRATG